jgi:hypothetical protein
MNITNRLRDRTCYFGIVAAVTMCSFLTYPHQERLLQAAEPTSTPTIVCVPDRPIAHPGETISVRVWIHGSPETQDVKWEKPSVGTIEGTTQAKWSFPKDETSVSSKEPARAQAFVKHKTLGKVECQLRVYFVPAPVILLGPKQPPILSGRTFLVGSQKEPEGYGLYTYILFGAPPRDDTETDRYLKIIESYLLLVRPIEQIEDYRERHGINITLIPLLKEPVVLERNLTEPKQTRELAIKLLANYNYTRAQVILADLGVPKITGGPFLVSRRISAKDPDAIQLRQDMSHVYPDLVRHWTETFLMLATQESSWTDQTLHTVRLNMLNIIAVAVTTPVIDEWIRVIKS